MPVGWAVAVLTDDALHPLQISRPVRVREGALSVAAPERPVNGSDLIVTLEGGKQGPGKEQPAVSLRAEDGGTRAPDVTFRDRDADAAVWYGVEGRTATLVLDSSKEWIAPQEIRLTPGRLGSHHAVIRPLPSLAVVVGAAANEIVLPETLLVTVSSRDGTRVREGQAKLDAPLLVEHLPRTILDVTVVIGEARVTLPVDLTTGSDETLRFELRPLRVTGKLRKGEEPYASPINFRTRLETIAVRSDDSGAYEAILWHPGRYLIEIPQAAGGPPFTQLERIEGHGTIDITIPNTRFVVSVADAQTAAPVASARIVAFNAWDDEQEGRRRASQSLTTGTDGRAQLAPLRSGSVTIHVYAAGYQEPEPVTIPVPSATAEADVEIVLRPSGTGRALTILLPNGGPAKDAEVAALEPSGTTGWRGSPDANGRVSVPDRLGAVVLLVRHPQAGSEVVRWTGEDSQIRLRPPAPHLLVRVRHADKPARMGHVTLLTPAARLSGLALGFFAWGPAVIAADGTWTARNLPHEPLRLIVATKTPTDQILMGAYDAVASTIQPPWPAALTLNTID